jgi:hypothetical protein
MKKYMNLENKDSEIYDLLEKMFNITDELPFNEIKIKKFLIHKGGKYKWMSGDGYTFIHDNITFTVSLIDYYEDTNDFKKKDLIVKSEYTTSKIENIKKDDIPKYLNSKFRVIKIKKFLFENK